MEEANNYRYDDTLYVALGKDFEEGRLNLIWALQNLEPENVCILHVHQPQKIIISITGGDVSASGIELHDQITIKEIDKRIMNNILDKYLDICHQVGVNAEKLSVEMDDIGEGLVALIYEHGIERLVMGAASDKCYSENMVDLKSDKAKYVRHYAPHSCHIWYTCGGKRILRGDGEFDRGDVSDTSLVRESSVDAEYRKSSGRAERKYNEELRRRRATEEKLFKEMEEHAETKQGRDEAVSKCLEEEEMCQNEYRLTKETEKAVAQVKDKLEKTIKERDEARLKVEIADNMIEEANKIAKNFQKSLEDYKKVDKLKKQNSKLLRKRRSEASTSSSEPPSYFICPISCLLRSIGMTPSQGMLGEFLAFKDIMIDPQVAADGHTYDRASIEEWLNNRDTSPMTNLRLTHTNMIPNNALRSAIREWLAPHRI